MKRVRKLNPFRGKLLEKSVADLKIAEGKLMKKKTKNQQDELKTIRDLITEKTSSH